MSSKNNVNPDHYKVAGRDRPNESLEPEHTGRDIEAENKRPVKGRRARNFIPGAAPLGESPKAKEEEEEEKD